MDTGQFIRELNAVTTDEISAEINTQLINYIKYSDGAINRIFFGGAGGGFSQAVQDNGGSDFPKMYISNVISEVADYGFNTAVRSACSDVQAWFLDHHQSVGETIVLNYFGAKFSSYISQEAASALKLKLCDNSFITGFAAEAAANDDYHKILNYWLMMKRLDNSAFLDVVNAWNTVDILKRIVDTYPSFCWLDLVNPLFSPGGASFADIFGSVRNACNAETLTGTECVSDVIDITSSGAPVTAQYIISRYTTGLDVKKWIESSSGYSTGANLSLPTSQTKEKAPASDIGCVIGGTGIVLKGGKVKAVETVNAGDILINNGGGYSVPSGELVISNHVKMLYSLNDDTPFMSPDHVILTPQGYKCLDPEAARQTNPGLEFGIIRENDSFYRGVMDGGGNLAVNVERVRKINVAPNEGKACYDIHISDGRKNYITENGYVCFANYPEITAGSIIGGLEKAKRTEEFKNLAKENRELFEAAFGKVAVEYFLSM
ncbi:MAG: hypothetical protein LBQ88_12980 [Treponema sp.]|jgi:hypothetical protein|nr:hypothetical protein [Treponema sp.]